MFAAMGLAAALAATPAEASAAPQAAQSAEQRDAGTSLREGIAAYERGDYAAAFDLFLLAHRQGDARGTALVGLIFETVERYPEAVRWYWEAANKGDYNAQNALGFMYQEGRGVPQDYDMAFRLHGLAASQENAVGQRALGAMYLAGQGVRQDYGAALIMFGEAANQGDAEAQVALGLMHHNGQGVPQNYVEAYKWYALSAAQGDTGAVTDRDDVLKRMTPAQIAEAQRLVAEWRPR